MAQPLETERRFFEANLATFLERHENEFALIHDRQAVSFHASEEEAVLSGRKRFGSCEPFLVALVTDQPRTIQLSSYLLSRRV